MLGTRKVTRARRTVASGGVRLSGPLVRPFPGENRRASVFHVRSRLPSATKRRYATTVAESRVLATLEQSTSYQRISLVFRRLTRPEADRGCACLRGSAVWR